MQVIERYGSVKKPYMEVFSHGKFVPVAQSLQVIERYGYRMKNKRYAHLLAVLGITVLVNAQTLTAYAAWNTYDQSIDNQIKTVQETEQVQTTTQNKKDENPFSAGVSVVFDETMKDDDKDEDTQENVALNARSVTDTAAVSTQETLHWGYQNLGIAHVDNNLNIRQEPSENAKLVGKLTKDAACEVLSTENGWAHIKSGKVEGYCNTEYLYTGDAAIERGKEAASMIAVVNTETLKVREEPNTDSTVITLIPQEEELEVVDVMDNGWIKFLLDDEEAYVSGDYVDVEERLEKAVSITELLYGQGVSDAKVSLVQYAKQFIGNPYVWGGTSLTSGADCSGFTMSVFKKYGISLPHHAASQAQMGTKVSLADAQPGDLVFYAKNGRINHVAIYIGGGQVVHASSPKTGIKISSVNYRTPAGVRRYL